MLSVVSKIGRISLGALLAATVTCRTLRASDGDAKARVALPQPAGAHEGSIYDAIVRTPAGAPAAKASVAIANEDSVIEVKNGRLDENSIATPLEADNAGRLRFRPEKEPFHLVILHSSGYAIYQPAPRSRRRVIHLDPWSRVEGIYFCQGKPRADIVLSIQRDEPTFPAPILSLIFVTETASTRADGHFAFDRVMSGKGLIGDGGSENEGHNDIQSSSSIFTNLPSGQTARVDFGRLGRPVVGKLRLWPPLEAPLRWANTIVKIENKTADGATSERRYFAFVEADGTFRFDDVAPGDCALEATLFASGVNHRLEKRLSLKKDNAFLPARPLDLGVLTLTPR